jgi:competence protein ComEC
MRMPIVAFALGVWALQHMPSLPAPAVLGGGVAMASAAAALVAWRMPHTACWPRRAAVALLAFACGFAWAGVRADWRLADALPMQWESRDVEVSGVVSGLPQPLDRAMRFVLAVESASAPVPRNIQLSWYAPRQGGAVPELRPGERWRLTVRLKRPHGFVNPHGFDYEAWLLERNVRATGYVRADDANARLAAAVPGAMHAVHRARAAVRARFAAALPDAPYAGILIALAVGDQRAIPNAQWEVFRRTAVAHVVSISGMHVSLVALAAGTLAGWAWRRSAWLMLRVPVRKAAVVAGLLAAAAYALLAGFGLPTQRALIMLAVGAAALLLGRETQGSRVMALALLAVLVADPWAVLSAGFWLSFGAVGVIVYVLSGRLATGPAWRSAVRLQLAITLATIPALLVLFNAFSLVAPLANAVAIPLVSFAIAPLALLAIVVPAHGLLALAHAVTVAMMVALEWFAALPFALWQQAATPAPPLAAALVGVAWLLLPRGTPGRAAAVLALVPLLSWTPPRPAAGEFRAVVLDVGQGLAVHVQTAMHDLLYDTGPPYGAAADAGSRVLLPYLAASGVKALDLLLISHGDSDHVGGAVSLLAGMPVRGMLAGLPDAHALFAQGPARARRCAAGQAWQWDGVEFEILHPPADDAPSRKANDDSCVLRVSGAGGALLLAGDIEAGAEARLVARAGGALASAVVVVPHHGSRTSSTPDFVAAVGAAHAIHAVGNLNPHRHPHPQAWARWSAAGAHNWRTDAQGAIHVEVAAGRVGLASQRARAPRYWHGR